MSELAMTPAGAPVIQAALSGGIERRTVPLTGIELRDPSETGDGQYTFIGHAAVFEQLSLPLWDWWYGEYREKIARGAFDTVLASDPDVHLVYVHDMASAMARTRSKTLELSIDVRGLRNYARLDPADPDVQRVVPKMKRGDVDQMSFAFSVAIGPDGQPREEWLIEGDTVTRTILEIGGLYDTTICPQGAYPQTDAGVRTLAMREQRQREFRGMIESAVEAGRLPDEAGAFYTRRAGEQPAGAESVAPEQDPAGVVSARERRAAAMQHDVDIARLHISK